MDVVGCETSIKINKLRTRKQEFQMRSSGKTGQIASFVLIGIGAVLLAMTIFVDGSLNIALPLVFLMLGCAFFILVSAVGQKWFWAALLYIPGSLLLAFGVIFLLNVLTNDWNAWAYAWLLLVAGLGLGMLLANRQQTWPQVISLVGFSLLVSGITFFALFGAITGGLFIQVMAPILLILGGLVLYWLRLETILPKNIMQRLKISSGAQVDTGKIPQQAVLIEPLSARELEVLYLVNQGLTNQEIALNLNVAPSTVKTHINNIYGKLDVKTRVQAVHRARELGLLGGDQ
jgi:DNA-binding CsgD family transcriptional regulator